MRSFAVLPLLAVVLVSLCGGPVPPPPSDVSGVVFFDANRNGIRDDCDASLPNRHVLLTNDEREIEEFASGPGEFKFVNVPSGEYVMSLKADPGTFWPVTTVGLGETIVLDLEGRDVEGIEVGAAVVNPLPTGPRVIGLAYNDADGDGRVSVDECGFGVPNVQTPNDVGDIPTAPESAGSFQFVSDNPSFPLLTVISPGLSDGHWWVQTSPPPPPGHCTSPVVPQPRYADSVFEVNVGFQLARGTASVSGVAFIDEDEDGERDAGERALDASMRLTLECDGDYQPAVFASSLRDKGYEFTGLPAGTYILSRERIGDFLPREFLVPVANDLPLTLADGEAATVDIAFRSEPYGTLIIRRYDDLNHNGQFDSDPQEPIFPDTPACYRLIDSDHTDCATPGQVVAGINVAPGTYEITMDFTDGTRLSETVTVTWGGTASVFLALRYGTLQARFFTDHNANGVLDAPDELSPGATFCFRRSDENFEACAAGQAAIQQLAPGTYDVWVDYPDGPGVPVTVAVEWGGTTVVDLPYTP